MFVDGHARFVGGEAQGGFIDAQGDVRRMLSRRDERQFALPHLQKGPGIVLIENLRAEVFGVKFDALGDIGGGHGDVIEFKHFNFLSGNRLSKGNEVFRGVRTSDTLVRMPDSSRPASQTPRRDGEKPPDKPNYFWRRVAVLIVIAATLYGIGAAAWALYQGARTVVVARLTPAPTPIPPEPPVDVLVVGGTPSGVAAALAAARHGAKVILVAERPKLGGDIIYAYLNMFDVPLSGPDSDESPVAYGIFGGFFKELGTAFDVQNAESWLERAIAKQKNVRVLSSAHVQNVLLQSGRVDGVEVKLNNGTSRTIKARAVVDSTNDADLAARAGAGYFLGREQVNPDKKMQAAGLLFSVKNVDWQKLRAYVRSTRTISLREARRLKRGDAAGIDIRVRGDRATVRMGGIHGNYAWERGEVITDYVPRGADVDVISINFGRQSDGSVMLNTLNIVGVNGLDEASRQRAYKEGVAEIPFLIQHLRRKMPGFAKADLGQIAPELYIRETRHIRGFTTLTVEDIKKGTPFPDRVALASYALDLHPYTKGDLNPFGPSRHVYALPLKALVPSNVDGVFVASRSLSATYSAAGSARVIPITMAAGEAVGTAAAQCAKGGYSPHELVKSQARIKQLQTQLRAAGMDVGDRLAKGG